ncbi:hypothetical protein [Paraburkholderia lacunae]|uniref:Uncharacterized protein n=1 Tax=Paraburkholderia lacunae TaxID=2211104 RepID=A0A370N6E4_9BURK|nr:hypothetical protein [Paraburkholderia lacunae]RDK01179.1 hypothetical protein DLM46_17775 [Paraburkholderia lacunae]
MQKLLISFLGALSLVMGLAGAPRALATTTTLTFDDIPSGSNLTTQYQNVGVAVSGASVYAASLIGVPANTQPNVAYAPSGLMSFTLNTAITGNVQRASAYLTGPAGIGIYAYDASNTLVGQVNVPVNVVNEFVTVTTFGNPIALCRFMTGAANSSSIP